MPHLILAGALRGDVVAEKLETQVFHWGRAVLKIDQSWCRADCRAVLVEGVVVEYSRPLHPLLLIKLEADSVHLSLCPLAPVERTPAVQRLLALCAAKLQALGGGPVVATNLSQDLYEDLGLSLELDDSA